MVSNNSNIQYNGQAASESQSGAEGTAVRAQGPDSSLRTKEDSWACWHMPAFPALSTGQEDLLSSLASQSRCTGELQVSQRPCPAPVLKR